MIKTAVVTGVTGSIGGAAAEALLKKGFAVCGSYRSDAEKARELAERFGGMPFYTVQADVSEHSETERLYAEASSVLGKIGVSVHCAGIESSKFLAMLPTEDWDRVIGVNLTGTYNCCKCAVRKMLPNKFGRIINISSAAAELPLAGQAAYAASKAGVNALTKALAKETAKLGITVNAVAPGFVRGKMADAYFEKSVGTVPAERFAEPEEVAAVICFLAGEETGYITGSVYGIDGGLGA